MRGGIDVEAIDHSSEAPIAGATVTRTCAAHDAVTGARARQTRRRPPTSLPASLRFPRRARWRRKWTALLPTSTWRTSAWRRTSW